MSNDAHVEVITHKLNPKFAEDEAISETEVTNTVRRVADELEDAPVQTFVPLIIENKARNELADVADSRQRDTPNPTS